MLFGEAWERVAMAGRELGSGPAAASEEIVSPHVVIWLMDRGITEERARTIALGVAVGVVMAEDPLAMEVLERIETEWRHRG